jgi:hypothetical protein
LSVPIRVSTVFGVTRDGGISVVIFILDDCAYASAPADKNSKVTAPNFNALRQFMVGTPKVGIGVQDEGVAVSRKSIMTTRRFN